MKTVALSTRGSPYLDAATSIAEQITRDALPAVKGLTWEGDDLQGDDIESATLIHGPIGSGLYGGNAGIGWFLGHMRTPGGSDSFSLAGVSALTSAIAEAQ